MAALKQHPWSLCSQPLLPFRYYCGLYQNTNNRLPLPPVCAMDDFNFRDGPLEGTKPKFIRSPYPSLTEPDKSPNSSERSKRGGRRPFRKATPLQAIAGAVVGGGWSVLAFYATQQAYRNIENHPPAHDLPLGLTSEVNQLFLTMLAAFGGLVVCMFGVSSVGLALLSIKLMTAPKIPPKTP